MACLVRHHAWATELTPHTICYHVLFSDLTLTCGTQILNVHQVVLYTQSKVFCNFSEGKFKARQSQNLSARILWLATLT